MAAYDEWMALCDAYAAADVVHRAALNKVTDNMTPGGRGMPSREDLTAWSEARDALLAISNQQARFLERLG
jgi:hypothetical protein